MSKGDQDYSEGMARGGSPETHVWMSPDKTKLALNDLPGGSTFEWGYEAGFKAGFEAGRECYKAEQRERKLLAVRDLAAEAKAIAENAGERLSDPIVEHTEPNAPRFISPCPYCGTSENYDLKLPDDMEQRCVNCGGVVKASE